MIYNRRSQQKQGKKLDNQPKTSDYEIFLRQFLQHRNQIFTFVFALVGNRTDTEDIFQEISTIMWRRFDQFEPGTNFLAWARQIGRNVVMDYRRKRRRHMAVSLDERIVEMLYQRYELVQDQIDDRAECLRLCLNKLDSKNRELVRMIYEQDLPVASVANRLNVSVQRIYQRLGAVHGVLLRCVKRTLVTQGN